MLVACLELELPNRTRCLRVSVRSGVLHALTEGGPAHDPLAALQVQLDQRLAGTPAHIGAALGRYHCAPAHRAIPQGVAALHLWRLSSLAGPRLFACFSHLSLPQPACLPVQSGALLSCYPAHMNHVRVHIGPSIGLFPVPTCSDFPREGRLASKPFVADHPPAWHELLVLGPTSPRSPVPSQPPSPPPLLPLRRDGTEGDKPPEVAWCPGGYRRGGSLSFSSPPSCLTLSFARRPEAGT